jgi:hypothetical protein
MKFLNRDKGVTIHSYCVELEPHERDWCDRRIITHCDRKGTLTNEQWQNVMDGAHPGHFGGHVERYNDNRCAVDVYVD